jgi:hypothetical protein
MNHLRGEKFGESALPFAPRKNLACRKILNTGEKYFFRVLTKALPEYYVFPQVSFNALKTHAHWITVTRWERFVRFAFNRKYVDLALCRKSDFEVIAIVEYDGSGHINHNDKRRDEMLTSVGYQVERFTFGDTVDSVRARFNDLREGTAN